MIQITPKGGPTSPPASPAIPPNDAIAVQAKIQQTPIFMAVLNELNVNVDQFNRRQRLIADIETALSKKYGCKNRLISYVLRFGHIRTSMSTQDIPSIETALTSISGAEQINLLIHSPGGDGTIAEKLIEMCRTRLVGNNQKLRVIVPNLAKSAATILALGADEILMGHLSELGPIDPQITIVVSQMTQWVSAFAFVEARDKLVTAIETAIKKRQSAVALLQQLAGLNIPFTDEMENQIEFSKKTAITLLNKYMLKMRVKDNRKRAIMAADIADKLLSKQLFPVHGHYIGGATAKQLGLEVDLLDKDDELWQLIWDYYIRCEVQMNIPLQPPMIKTKLFESGNQISLITQDMP
jgi:ClpP class serine protease